MLSLIQSFSKLSQRPQYNDQICVLYNRGNSPFDNHLFTLGLPYLWRPGGGLWNPLEGNITQSYEHNSKSAHFRSTRGGTRLS